LGHNKSLWVTKLHFVAILAPILGKCRSKLLKRNLARVAGRHRSGAMPHVLTNDGRIDSGEFPSSVAAVTKGVHSRFRQTSRLDRGMQTVNRHIGFTQWGTVSRMKDKGSRNVNAAQESLEHSQSYLAFAVSEKHDSISRRILARSHRVRSLVHGFVYPNGARLEVDVIHPQSEQFSTPETRCGR